MISEKPATSQTFRWTSKLIFKSNGFKRTIASAALLAYFILSLYVGVPFVILNTLIIQIKSFQEVMDIAYRIKKFPHIPSFKRLLWYFIFTFNYFCLGELYTQYIQVFINKYYFLYLLVSSHRLISFSLYLMGLIIFVRMLDKDLIGKQFSLLFWTHFLMLVITLQSHYFVHNVHKGYIWIIVPLFQICLNDVFAYLVGKNFGKIPLITLSPRKTVEGFIGGGVATIIIGTLISYVSCHFNYLICPTRYAEINNRITTITNCTPDSLFRPTPYRIGNTGFYLNYYPFLKHTINMGIFISLVAPFGGFFASGFKRAADITDFGNVIPGHGGFLDRFDCFYLTGSFMSVYINTFARHHNPEDIFQNVLTLGDDKLLEFYLILKTSFNENILHGINIQ